jgi:hypothetical protein
MDFYNYTTGRDWTRQHAGRMPFLESPEQYYKEAMDSCLSRGEIQACAQFNSELNWELARRPYYNLWPSVIPLLTRLNLDLDARLIQLPMPSLCLRLPKENNPLTFDWKGEQRSIHCMLLSDINDKQGISILIDVGEHEFGFPVYTYRNFRRGEGLTVEAAIRELKIDWSAELGVIVPETLTMDCVRLCCTLCLLENDPSIISPDVLSADRAKYERTPEARFVDKARRRGKIGWDVGRSIEMIPHIRRPHPALVWTGHGRAVPKIIWRKGSVIHRDVVQKLPSGFLKPENK